MTTIQDLCLSYQCNEAQLVGAERGPCDCPCHSMTDSERESFLELALGDFHDAVCTGPGVPPGFTCSHPSHREVTS